MLALHDKSTGVKSSDSTCSDVMEIIYCSFPQPTAGESVDLSLLQNFIYIHDIVLQPDALLSTLLWNVVADL